MISYDDAKKFIANLPWPPHAPRPRLSLMGNAREGYRCLLYKPLAHGWTDIAKTTAPTPEAALAEALEGWFTKMGLNNQPALYAAIKRLAS